MSRSWGSYGWDWGGRGQWDYDGWASRNWQEDGWGSTGDHSGGSQDSGKGSSQDNGKGSKDSSKDSKQAQSRALRRTTTEEGKEHSNRTYLGGDERTSLTREDRLKLAWSVIHCQEPPTEISWKPEWIQRADLQLASGVQLDALIYLTAKFQPATNLRTFSDLRPDTVRETVRASYVSRQPRAEDRTNFLDEISRHRDDLDVIVRWAEYNHFQPGADPKAPARTSLRARAPKASDRSGGSGQKLGWLYLLPPELTWGDEEASSAPGALSGDTARRTLRRRSTDEDTPQPVTFQSVIPSCDVQPFRASCLEAASFLRS